MNKSKKIKTFLAISIIIAFTIFMIIRANVGFPQKGKIEKFSLNEYIDCGNISIKFTDKKIVGKESSGFPIAAIDIKVKNKTSKSLDISNISEQLFLYSNFDGSIVQNVDRGFGGDEFSNYYSKEDLKLDSKEEKEFVFNYIMYKDINNYENFIYLDNSLYKKEFNDYVNKGIILYKTIDLGEFDE